MSDEQTSEETAPAPAPDQSEQAVIDLTANGPAGFTLESFQDVTGTEIEDIPDVDEEEPFTAEMAEEEERQEQEDPKEDDEEEEDSDSEEEESEDEEDEEDEEEDEVEDSEEDEDADELPKSEGKTIEAKTPDGTTYDIPEDLVILQKVDGEIKELPLKEHMSMVAGELTVNQRMGKVASLKAQIDNRAEQVDKQIQERIAYDKQIASLCDAGKIDQAICVVAKQLGVSPVPMIKKYYQNAAANMKRWKGKSPEAVENHFLQLEAEFERSRMQERDTKEQEKTQFDSFVKETQVTLAQKGITQEEFHEIHSELQAKGALVGKTLQDARDIVIKSTIQAKIASRILGAISRVDPKLVNDDKLVRRLESAIVMQDYDEDRLEEMIRIYLSGGKKSRASNLSRKARKNSKAAPSKKNSGAKPIKAEGKTAHGLTQFDKMFGFSS